MTPPLRRWTLALLAAAAVGLVAVLTNITTRDQLEGRAPVVQAVRLTLSMLANAGVLWAGISVLAGWFVRRPVQAAIAGVLAGEMALVAHYGAGTLLGLPESVVQGNELWFAAAAIAGAPLGLVGAAIHRPDPIGRLAALVVPVGAVAEPFVRGAFTPMPILPWPTRVASVTCGVLLVVGGLVGGWWALGRPRPRRARHPSA